ncbi:MAG: ABC transporter permease [Acidobacteriia bacterium]|nr:ABC transporter permease [Terriglobia bacterium]
MLARILLESLTRRRRRRLLGLLAIALGIAVAAAVGTLAVDVGDKVSRELRSFGANISVRPAADSLAVTVGGVDYRPVGAGAFLPEDQLVQLKRIFWRNNIVAFAPFLDVPVTLAGNRTVLVGTWFDKSLQVDKSEVFETGLEKLHPAWKIQGHWPADVDPNAVLVGRRLAERLGLAVGQTLPASVSQPNADPGNDSSLRLRSSAVFTVCGILETGGTEDDEMLASLTAVQKLAGLEGKIRRVEISALTKPEDAFAHSDPAKLAPADLDRWMCTPYVSSIAFQIQQAIPGSEAKPVYQVAETEGKIVDRVGVLMAVLVAAALVVAALAVASIMLASVLERRAEIGLFAALGATHSRVAVLFLLEASALGLLGGVAGYFLGSLLAWRLALAVFGVPVGLHWVILPACLALALGITLLGSALPVMRALKISPAAVLRD